MGEDQTLLWEAGGCDGGGEADGRRQLDQGDVVAAAYRGNTQQWCHIWQALGDRKRASVLACSCDRLSRML